MRKALRLGVVLILCAAASDAQSQDTKKKGPTVQELQQRVIDLQQQLLECRQAPKEVTPAGRPDPYAEALDGFRTFKSTVDTGVNQAAYRDALIPLKVKVDRLEVNEKNNELKEMLGLLVDAGQLWNVSITQASRGWVLASNVQPFIAKYPIEWNGADSDFAARMKGMRCYFQFGNSPEQFHDDCVRSFSGNVIARARRELEVLINAKK